MSLIKKDESYKLKTVIEKVKQNEAKKQKIGSSYVNPCALRIGTFVNNQKRIFFIMPSNYSPA